MLLEKFILAIRAELLENFNSKVQRFHFEIDFKGT